MKRFAVDLLRTGTWTQISSRFVRKSYLFNRRTALLFYAHVLHLEVKKDPHMFR